MKLSKTEKILVSVARLASPQELPKNSHENYLRIWEAFSLGKTYERTVSELLKRDNY